MRFTIEINPCHASAPNGGMAQSAFDPDSNTFKVFVDITRVPDVRTVPGIVGHELAHFMLDVLNLWQNGRSPVLESTVHDYITNSLGGIGTQAASEGPFCKPRSLNDLTVKLYEEGQAIAAGHFADTAMTFFGAFDTDDTKGYLVPEPKDAETTKAIAAAVVPETREYDVTIRRPTWAYGHMTVTAASADAAIAETKDILNDVNRRSERPSYDSDCDSMDPADWISAEGPGNGADIPFDHAEWEAHTVSGYNAKLMQVLQTIRQLAISTGDNNDNRAKALVAIYDAATSAIATTTA
jgi:hypothetical protein